MCSCWWGSWWFRRVLCVFVSWWRACVPRVRCAGCIKRGENAWLVLSPFFLCGANDGTRTRCLHLGRVTLRLLSFNRSVFPGCSLLVCLRWGVERMTGLEPAASTLARWRSGLLSYIRSVRQPRLLRRAGLGAYLSVSFMSVRGARCFRQPHAVVISVTRCCCGRCWRGGRRW